MKITVAGIGPGDVQYLLPIVKTALAEADAVIGYDYYFQFIEGFLRAGAEQIRMPLGKEEARAQAAIDRAQTGANVVVIGSGDASIYSMAAIVYELAAKMEITDIELNTLPGISAFQAAGSLLGAPLGHDFCCLSLSDLMTPWAVIEKRIKAAAMGDFVTCLYNPRSVQRHWQLHRLRALFLEERQPDTPVAIVRHATRKQESQHITTLEQFDPNMVDMFCLVLIGNSQTFQYQEKLVTPRGYLHRKPQTGPEIQQESFRLVAKHLQNIPMTVPDKWVATRVIHTTGVLSDHEHYQASEGAIVQWEAYLKGGGHIVTDVTMVKAGITKSYLSQYGVQTHCLLNDEAATQLAEKEGLTRSQAAMRLAIAAFPNALYVVGNAPTALIEITDEIIRNPQFKPAGVIGVPVGFVNVLEAKAQLACTDVPQVIINGHRGGSNVAAAIVNAAFTLEAAENYYETQNTLAL